ncbi:MAG: DUF1549 domain-containing protein, partial [Planctomycetaceae bacterium]|nr:DUF1549 domain-containing protein [Planctomycetaceae bacterium]
MQIARQIAVVCLSMTAPAFAEDVSAREPVANFAIEDVRFYNEQVEPLLKAHCYQCHGTDAAKGGLRLTARESILRGGDSGSAVDLEAIDRSLLLEAINYQIYEMPPSGKLPADDIALLRRWVEMGLPMPIVTDPAPATPESHGPPQVNEETKSHWAFRPVVQPIPPDVRNTAWIANPIDAFILSRLEQAGLEPAPPATKAALIRRLTYDLTGLPPHPEDVAEFIADDADDAYERLVERLLDSKHYGEHWARYWLDLVRYAETNSFERDNPKPFVWRYRDYVIQSFNSDKPYDQFIREQLAGDELDDIWPESIIATGYYRLGLWDDEPADPVLAFYDGLDDIAATTAQVFLGLTLNCA